MDIPAATRLRELPPELQAPSGAFVATQPWPLQVAVTGRLKQVMQVKMMHVVELVRGEIGWSSVVSATSHTALTSPQHPGGDGRRLSS